MLSDMIYRFDRMHLLDIHSYKLCGLFVFVQSFMQNNFIRITSCTSSVHKFLGIDDVFAIPFYSTKHIQHI